MIKLIRNNQKKFIAGTGVVLMITFAAGYGGPAGNGRGHAADREIGRVGGKAVMASDAIGAQRELAAVNQYARRFGSPPSGGPSPSLLDRALGADVAANLRQRPELFVLLRREALNAGVVPNPTQAQQLLDETLGGTGPDGSPVDAPSPDSDTYKVVQEGVTDLLTVVNYYGRVTAALKPSRPAVDRELGTTAQTIQLTLVPVPAEGFKAQVPPPTTQQVADQFKRFADTPAGRPDPVANPFGFGYRVPMLVNLQYVRLTRDAVEKAVVATKSDYDWEVDARKLYHAHPEQFAVAPPTTRPTDAPGPAVTPPFEKVRDDALRSLRGPLIQALQDQVQQFLAGALARDYAAYRSAVTAGSTVPATPVGQPYSGPSYLQALTDQANGQFHVRLTVETGNDLSAEQLQKLPHLAAAQAALSSSSTADASLPGYVSDRALSYLASGEPKTSLATADLLRPSPAFNEEDGSAVDFVRLSSVKPAHPAADLAAVRPMVVDDLTTAAAYELARAQADRLTAAAANGTMPFVASAAGLHPIASQQLSMNDVTIDGLKPPLADAAHDFLTQAFGLLDTFDPVKNPYPAKAVPLPTQRRLIVAQLTFVNVRWTPADYAEWRMEAAQQVLRQRATAARAAWFNADAIVERTGFTPSAAPSGT